MSQILCLGLSFYLMLFRKQCFENIQKVTLKKLSYVVPLQLRITQIQARPPVSIINCVARKWWKSLILMVFFSFRSSLKILDSIRDNTRSTTMKHPEDGSFHLRGNS